jgi:hypothetical protein
MYQHYQSWCILKKGMPFNLSLDDENKIVGYVTEMQSIGFESTAIDTKRYVFHIGKKNGREKNSSTIPLWFCVSVANGPNIS